MPSTYTFTDRFARLRSVIHECTGFTCFARETVNDRRSTRALIARSLAEESRHRDAGVRVTFRGQRTNNWQNRVPHVVDFRGKASLTLLVKQLSHSFVLTITAYTS